MAVTIQPDAGPWGATQLADVFHEAASSFGGLEWRMMGVLGGNGLAMVSYCPMGAIHLELCAFCGNCLYIDDALWKHSDLM